MNCKQDQNTQYHGKYHKEIHIVQVYWYNSDTYLLELFGLFYFYNINNFNQMISYITISRITLLSYKILPDFIVIKI